MFNILIEFGVPMKLLVVRLIKVCKHFSDAFPIESGLK